MSTSTWVLLLFCTYLKCLLLFWKFFKKFSVLCLWSSSFFYCKWWVPEQTQTQTQTLVLLGLMLVSLCALLPLFSLHWLWHHATLRSNWAIKPLTSMLCQESGLTQRFSLFGRSSSEPEELPSCHSDTAVSDKDSSEDIICNRHTCKVLVLVWRTDASWLPQSILAL